MFKKRTCKKCGEKANEKYEFCPHCGSHLNDNSKKEDWGMLGKKDSTNELEEFSNQIFGGISGKMINKMLGSAMKMLEKEMRKEMNNKNTQPRTNFELIINGKRVDPNKIKISRMPQRQIPQEERKGFFSNRLSREKLEKASKLPKQDPVTNMKRFSDKIIYEIDVPGVKSVKDISIIKLENSIEIKALSKDKVYLKLIPVNLPIINYSFEKGKLFLELGVGN